MALCFLFNVILGYLLIHTISAANVLPAHLGFAVSTGFQSAPLTPSQIGVITSSYILSDTKHYKFFGWPSDHDIAVGILNASSSPQDITFYIGFQTPITQLDISHLEALAAEWDDVKENVYCVALVNEPDYNSVDFSILPAKLNMTSSFFQSKSQWNHVVVSIPFSTLIFAKTWPVPESEFLEEHKPYLSQIIDIYKQYGAPFSINLYPFYVAPHEPTLMGYILGEEPAEYSSMFVAQYMALWYAMEALSPTNGLDIVVTETGWSTFSSNPTYAFATLENAQIYYDNTFQQMKDVQSEVYGVRVYAFELFDEDQKGGSNLHWEANWGVFDVHAELKWNLLNETASPTAIPSIGPSKVRQPMIQWTQPQRPVIRQARHQVLCQPRHQALCQARHQVVRQPRHQVLRQPMIQWTQPQRPVIRQARHQVLCQPRHQALCQARHQVVRQPRHQVLRQPMIQWIQPQRPVIHQARHQVLCQA
eukprot:713104_1